jgi:hypothetical protein
MNERVRVETPSRWDALALARRLPAYRWHLLQADADHWHVCVELAQQRNKLPRELRDAIQRWLGERQLAATVVHTATDTCVIESPASGVSL